MSDCERIRDDLGRREAGLLEDDQVETLRRHLAGCPDCRSFSGRMRTLVALLEDFPEIRELPRPSLARRFARGPLFPAAAALLLALAVPAVGSFFGNRVVLEGSFDRPEQEVLVARDSDASLVLAGHRLRFARGTRARLRGDRDVDLETGRLDVAGRGPSGTGLAIGTPLGRIEVVGTAFVVEVMPMRKTDAAMAAGSFVVGVLVSSGAVTYADHRLEAGQGIVHESGGAPRKVTAAEIERRLRTASDRERELETRLAALAAEKARLGGELAARQRGEAPPPRAALSPEERRVRARSLAQALLKDSRKRTEVVTLSQEEMKKLSEGQTVELQSTVTHESVDITSMSEILNLAEELGLNFFDRGTFLARGDVVEEFLLAVLEEGGAPPETLRAAVEAAVRGAGDGRKASWDSGADRRADDAHALGRALTRLEGSLRPEQLSALYDQAHDLVPIPSYVIMGLSDASSRARGVDTLAKELQVDAAGKVLLESVVGDWSARFGKEFNGFTGDAKGRFGYSVRLLDLGADLVREVTARFPDRKAAIERTLGQ